MFGMLDYRAHKLYRLLSLPIVISARIAFFIAVAIAIWIAVQFDYGFLIRFAIAYVSMELIAMLFGLVYLLVMWIFSPVFFWTVDVIPARGADKEEARNIVQHGRVLAGTQARARNPRLDARGYARVRFSNELARTPLL